MASLRLWKWGKITGLWRVERTVTEETAQDWLKVFEKLEPKEYFKLSKNKPSIHPVWDSDKK